MNPLSVILLAFAIALAVTLVVGGVLMLSGKWMKRRGWLDSPKDRKSTGPIRGILSTFQEIVQPEIRQMREDQHQRAAETGEKDPSDR